MTQTWIDLLFAHWPVGTGALRHLVPPELEIDTYDGTAWIAVVPFGIIDLRGRFMPPLPFTSAFLELNVRTYVRYKGQPGVYFFSLDAANPLAVEAARMTFHLNYLNARMKKTYADDGSILYHSERTDRREGKCSFACSYKPIDEVHLSEPGSLIHWLTERYCLFTTHKDSVYIGEIHHAQWPLQTAVANFTENSMLAPIGLKPLADRPLLHFARKLVTYEWPPRVDRRP